MKRKVLLLLIVALPLITTAQYKRNYNNRGNYQDNNGVGNDMCCEAGSAVTIFSESGDRFLLIINGIKQNSYPDTRVRVEGLPEVTNDIEIIFDDNRTPAIMKRIAFMDPVDGKPVNLVMKIVRERGAYPRLCFHKLTTLEMDYRGEQGEYVMHYGRDNQPRQVINNPPPPPPPPAPTPMDMQSFKAAKQAIKNSNWDDTRLSTAQSIANSNYFTADQVIEICKLFTWDESKLTFAKYAFKKTLDNNNYFKVNGVLDWDASKTALNDYVNSNR